MAFDRGYPAGHATYRRGGCQRFQEGYRAGTPRAAPGNPRGAGRGGASGTGGGGAGAELARLVEEVKAAQKTGEVVRTQWRDYCDVMGNGTRDPNKHCVMFLRKFFELQATRELPICEEPLHKRPIPGPNCDPLEAHTILVAKVKCGQQASPTFNAAWWAFSDGSAGTRDPSGHDVSSLTAFLLGYATEVPGGLPDKNPYAAPPRYEASPLTECVKSMQSARLVWKHQWDHFCDSFGGGVRDPSRHPPAFLQQFLDQVTPKHPQSRSASQQGGLPAPPPPVVKRRTRAEKSSSLNPAAAPFAVRDDSRNQASNEMRQVKPALFRRDASSDDNDSTSTHTGDDSSLSGCSTIRSRRRSSSAPPRRDEDDCAASTLGKFGIPPGSRVRNTFLEWDEHFLEQLWSRTADSP